MDKNKLKDSAIIGASAAVGSGVSSYVTAELLAREEEEAEPESVDGREEPSVPVDTANALNTAMEPSSEAEVSVLTVEPVRPAEPAEPVGSVEPAEPAGPAVAAVHPEVPAEVPEDEENALVSIHGGPEEEDVVMMYGGPGIEENQINIDIDPVIYGGPADDIYPLDDDYIYS